MQCAWRWIQKKENVTSFLNKDREVTFFCCMCGKKVPTFFFRALSALALRFFSLSKKCAKNTCREDTSKQQRLAQRTGKQVVPFLLSFLAGKLLKASSSHFPLFFFGGGQKKMQRAAKPEMQPFFFEEKNNTFLSVRFPVKAYAMVTCQRETKWHTWQQPQAGNCPWAWSRQKKSPAH